MSDKFSKAGKTTSSTELVTGVTGRTYGTLGSDFVRRNPSKTTVIVRMSSAQRDEAGKALEVSTEGLKQWGAWNAYLKRIGYSTALMEKRDYWTVPAPLPSDFDAEATIVEDQLAGEAYLEARRKSWKSEAERGGELRRVLVASKLGYDPSRGRRASQSTSEPLPSLPASPDDLKSPARPASDALRASVGLPPKPKKAPPPQPDDFVEGFDIR